MPSVNCPACDEDMEIERDWYGRKVECPSCGKRFVTARPGEDADDDPDEKPKPRRAWDEDEDEDDRPRRKKTSRRPERPKVMGRGAHQLLVVCVVGGGLLLCCLGCFGWVAFQMFGPAKYPEPWVAQSLPDGSYSVRFPRSPTTDTTGGGFGERGTKWMIEEPGFSDAACMFGYVDDPFLPFDAWFDADVNNIKSEIDAKMTPPKVVSAAGLPGKEVEFSGGGGKIVYRVFDASRGGQKRYILVMAGGRNMSEADRTKFLDSFKQGR